MPEFTSEQILAGIAQAIAERNFDAAIAMTKLLAVQAIANTVTFAASGALS